MEKSIRKLLAIFIIVAVAAFTVFAAAEEQKTAAQPVDDSASAAGSSGVKGFRDWFHNPTDWLSMEADLKWEWFYGWNIDTLQDDAVGQSSKWHYTLNRFRWGTKSKITDDIEFNHRWVWEFRTWDDPYNYYDKSVDFDEIAWDRFNLTLRNVADAPLTAVIGRQDIIFGTGWLVLDGTPFDEGRTIYFDAIRLTYQMQSRDTTLDMVYIEQPARSSRHLAPISGDNDKLISGNDTRGAIFYVTDKTIENLQLEGYFIYKNSNAVNSSAKDEIYTVGGAMCGPIGSSEHWKYRIEGAMQLGDKNRETMRAFGTNNRLEYNFNDEKKSELHACLEYLTGDDPDTDKNEAFDPLWGEWPQWSIINSYVYMPEAGPSHVTNLQRIGVGHSFWPTEKIQICTDYHLLWADQNTRKDTPDASGLIWADNGKFRGQLATCWLKYTLTKNLKGFFLVEYFVPGNYYDASSRDHAFLCMANVEYTF